ncbi:transcriptional regulator, XRE family [Candidatus Moduliflexus flocculans]|uniref:Transcriptional regulator, XRE family n=1 Tax=Candidatus Moduliflexus flocculans TaxID=1499966 RepID=A0A081BSL3_9BACT|nr:transcriptional regulator, XRE family [Candidatus Moduliflexus flocculans]
MKFGESLRKERELRQITLEEISQHTRVHPRFLDAIENDDFSVLPAKAFAKGFLRSYARMVDLDEDLVIANFEYCQHATQRSGAMKGTQVPAKKKTFRRVFVVAVFLIIALLLALIILVTQGHVQINWL